MASLRSWSPLAFACLLVVGCNSKGVTSTSDGGADGTAGTGGIDGSAPNESDAAVSDGSAEDGPCNELENGAAPVDEIQVAASVPVGVAGPLGLGTYYLTGAKRYTGPDGASGPTGKTRQETLVLSSYGINSFIGSSVESRAGGPAVRTTRYWNFSGSDSRVQLLQSCPGPVKSATVTFSYDEASSTLAVFGGFADPREVSIYAKQAP
jgi:hypothetical protein